MLTSRSTQGCRLTATEPHVMRVKGSSGLWTGDLDLATMPGKSRPVRKASKRNTKGSARKCRNR